MKRFDPSNKHEDGMAPRTDGEWVRYSDHVEAMKRIAGEGQAEALPDADINKIAETMPGGMDGFLNGWGWINFARAVEGEVLSRTATPAAHVAQGLTDERNSFESVLKSLDWCVDRTDLGAYRDRTVENMWKAWKARALLAQSAVTEPLQGTQEPSTSAQQAESVTDAMALAFHRATTDGAIGSEDLADIKAGLRAALIAAQPPAAAEADKRENTK